MAELSAAGRAEIGRNRAMTSIDIRVTTVLIGLAVVMAAFVLSWAAEGAVPRSRYFTHAFTEHEGPAQDFHDHLASAQELLQGAVYVPAVYPDRTAPGITATMHRGWHTSRYQLSDMSLRGGGPRLDPW